MPLPEIPGVRPCELRRSILRLLSAMLGSRDRSPQEAFASIDVYPDRLELRGHGVIESRTIHLPSRVGELLVG